MNKQITVHSFMSYTKGTEDNIYASKIKIDDKIIKNTAKLVTNKLSFQIYKPIKNSFHYDN